MPDDPATPTTELEEILAATPLDGHRRLRHGASGATSQLVCGGFMLEGGGADPIPRLAHAACLLHKTDAPLAQIAARSGYGTEYSFSRAFKRAFGVAPGGYRLLDR